MNRAHYIGVKCLYWLFIGQPHNRLRREMEDEIRPNATHNPLDSRQLAYVSNRVRLDSLRKLQLREQTWLRRRRQRKAVHLGAKRQQPLAEPRALETGMSRHEDTSTGIGVHQTFHGALPSLHICSSICFSRNVSIGCQKPLCLYAISCPAFAMRSSGSRSSIWLSPSM